MSDKYTSTSSPYINSKVRRPIPKPFQSLICPSSLHKIPTYAESSSEKIRFTSANDAPIEVILAEGEVISHRPSYKRRPPLYRIGYKGISVDSDAPLSSSSAWGYTEEITEEELKSALSSAAKRVLTSLSSNTLQTEVQKISSLQTVLAERYSIGMEIEVGHKIVWKLVIVASLELVKESRVRAEYEALVKKTQMQGLSTKSRRRSRGARKDLRDDESSVECPKYYSRHPTSYLGGQYQPEKSAAISSSAENSNLGMGEENSGQQEEQIILAPSQLAQRVKLGASKAYEFFALFQNLSSGGETGVVRRSARGIQQGVKGEEEYPLKAKLPKSYEAGGCVALSFLKLLNLFPDLVGPSDDEKIENSESEEEDEEDKVEENEEEDDINPFFKPNSIAILEYLGRKQKSLSPADIQTAICYALEDSISVPRFINDNSATVENGSNNSPTVTNEMKKEQETLHACLVCTTGDKIKDLPEFEPQSFSRCRFAVKTFVPEPDNSDDDDEEEEEEEKTKVAEKEDAFIQKEKDAALQREREAAEKHAQLLQFRRDERIWKARKQYETWRFKSVQSGCTIWPSWNNYVLEKLKKKQITKENNDSQSISKENIDGEKEVPLESAQTVNGGNNTLPVFPAKVLEKEEQKRQEEKDAALARILANSDEITEDMQASGNGSTGMTAVPSIQRRSRRAARGETTTDAVGGVVFYGSNQSLSPAQLLETIHRLVWQSSPRYLTLLDLKRLLMEDHEGSSANDLKRIRAALGKLLFRLGKINRILVTVDSDEVCWKRLSMGSNGSQGNLITLEMPIIPVLEASSGVISTTNDSLSHEQNVKKEEDKSQPLLSNEQESLSLKHIEEQEQNLVILQDYLQSLHSLELNLRSILLTHFQDGKGLQRITPAILGSAADERENEMDAMDGKAFLPKSDNENGGEDEIEWITSSGSHPLLDKVFCRPSLDVTSNEADVYKMKCSWYKVTGFTPSIPLSPSEETNGNTGSGNLASKEPHDNLKDNTIVQRRARFRAVPTSFPIDKNLDGTVDDSTGKVNTEESTIILTEAQVYAGIKAAEMIENDHTKYISSKRIKDSHPFREMAGMRILLTPLDQSGSKENEFEYGMIVGHDSVLSEDGVSIDQRVLILLDEKKEESYTKNVKKPSVDIKQQVGDDASAFWANLLSDNSICVLNSDAKYKISSQEYHPSSPAYKACESVLSYLKSSVKSTPFMDPVDPVALNIPDYFDVIMNPMDISTVEKNLIGGKYGRIPPGTQYCNPISKMLNGPFYLDLMLIFDNAMTFNPVGDWIYNDAVQLKRLVSKKIETLSSKAEIEHGQSPSSNRGKTKKKSVYVDEDSDVDMYEYESDYDDEDNGHSRTKKKRKRSRANGSMVTGSKGEAFATRAIEAPIREPNYVELGIFSVIPTNTDARYFGLPEEWSCRHIQTDVGSDDKIKGEDNEKIKQEQEEMDRLMLLQMQLDQQVSSIRRSSRAQTVRGEDTEDIVDDSKVDFGNSLEKMEYYLPNDFITDRDQSLFSTIARNRSQVESVRESMHEEYFAEMYYKYYSSASNAPMQIRSFQNETDDEKFGYGSFTDGTFPPYLGRIVQIDCAAKNSNCTKAFVPDNIVWEIRAPYLVPALRWVMRGLVRSGHLAELEPLASSWTDSSINSGEGIVITNHAYYCSDIIKPFDVLDAKEMQRRRRLENVESSESEEEEEVELSAYEKLRAERVARNKERLKTLGLV